MAVPHPEAELDNLRTELRARGLPSVVVLSGPADFFRVGAFDEAVAAVPEGSELRRLDGAGDAAKSDGRELHELRGAGLFASGTYLAVRRAKGWLDAHADEIAATLPAIGSGCGLILELPKLDKRTKLAKALQEVGRSFEFRELYAEPFDRQRSPLDAELVGWVVDRARKVGVKLAREAAFQLMVVVGKSPGELAPEIDALAERFAGRGSKVVDVADLGAGGLDARFESTPFEFVEALLADDRVRAMRSLQAMFARGVRSKDGQQVDAGGVFPFLTSWLSTSLVQVHAGRALVEAGAARPDDVARKVGVRGFADRYRDQVAMHPEVRLRRGLFALREAQRRLRSSGEDPQRLLEAFVAQWFAGRSPRARGAKPASGGGRARGRRRG